MVGWLTLVAEKSTQDEGPLPFYLKGGEHRSPQSRIVQYGVRKSSNSISFSNVADGSDIAFYTQYNEIPNPRCL